MWKKTTILIPFLVLLAIFGIQETSAAQVYLPKADLVRGSGYKVYVLENGVRRWIPDIKTFEYFKYNWKSIKTISDDLLNSYLEADNLKRYRSYPEGSLIKGSGPEVYLIELGKRRWIPNPAIFNKHQFDWNKIITLVDKNLNKIKKSDNLRYSESRKYPNTVILNGPEQGGTIRVNEVTFTYSGTNPLGARRDLSFETFLVGYDTKWRSSSRDNRTYRLPEESGSYTFYVRAKNKQGYLDPTPVKRSFQVGVSSDYQKVEIKRVRYKEKDFRDDYLIVRNQDEGTINITGWTIETDRARVTIPQAINKLKHPFLKDDSSDIKLAYREEALISVGPSPRGVSFRTNQCTGYLDQTGRFYPSLDEGCPRLDESEYDHLGSACVKFIKRLKRCQIPDYSSNSAVSTDSQCISFLNEKFNYQACYLDYCQKVDFFEKEWRVFLNRSIDIFDNSGDKIVLKDKKGLVVDQYSY